VSPVLCDSLRQRVGQSEIEHHARVYRAGDLRGFFLAYAATSDETVNRAIAGEAEQTGTLLNVVDHPSLCTFICPAVVGRGDLTVAVSTNGASPALARRVRR